MGEIVYFLTFLFTNEEAKKAVLSQIFLMESETSVHNGTGLRTVQTTANPKSLLPSYG